MIKRIVVVETSAKVSSSRSQIHIKSEEKDPISIPAEDLGSVVIESDRTLITIPALKTLAEKGSSLVVCDEKFLPSGIFLPLKGHFQQTLIIRDQVNCSIPTQKRL